jgi:lactate permease
MLADVTGLDELKLSAMAGRQLPFFSLIVPVWLIWTMAGFRATLQIWPALLVSGGSFALVQFLVSNFHGPWLVDVAGGIISLVSLTLLLQFWQPRQTWRFADEQAADSTPVPHSPRQVVFAWLPWALLTVMVVIWATPFFKTKIAASVERKVEVTGLHRQVSRHQPVAATDNEPEDAFFNANWLSATGTGIFLAALFSAIWMKIGPVDVLRVFLSSCYRMRWPLFTIACMLAIAFTTRFSGMDATLGLAFTKTGYLYPLFAALLGWLGVALTGSDTSANALFGSLQKITAGQLANNNPLPLTTDQAQILMATANSTGGVMGKMIDAQSIVVSTAATGQPGQEGAILRFVFLHSVALAILLGLLVLFQAYVWTSAIP